MNKEEKLSLIKQLKDRISKFDKQEDHIFPWADVISSMEEYLDDIEISEECCPFCGENIVSLYFSSPEWTWENLMGRAGDMKICVNCDRQLDFDCMDMN